MAENKVRFGLKNVYYAVLTESSDGTANTYATPVAVPGAVSLTMDSNVSDGSFYADNITYYKTYSNNGYTGSLEMARINDAMLEDVFGFATSSNNLLVEKSGVQPKPFALLFQIEGDAEAELNALYRVVPTSKPSAGSETVGESIEPGTQTFDFEALPLVTGTADELGLVRSRTTETTAAGVKSAWFTAVTLPTA